MDRFLVYAKTHDVVPSKHHKPPKFWVVSSSIGPVDGGEASESADFTGRDVLRTVKQRVDQALFREALLDEFEGSCPLTKITERPLLRASHTIAWSTAGSEAHRLNPKNGILLSSLWDAAFDKGLVSFTDTGRVLWSEEVSATTKKIMKGSTCGDLRVDKNRAAYLAEHRKTHGYE